MEQVEIAMILCPLTVKFLCKLIRVLERGARKSVGRFLNSVLVQGRDIFAGSPLPETGFSPKAAARICLFFLVYLGLVFYSERP